MKRDAAKNEGITVADRVAPPLGAFPRFLWEENHPEPTEDEVEQRIKEVQGAIDRYRAAGVVPFRQGQWEREIDELTAKYGDVPIRSYS